MSLILKNTKKQILRSFRTYLIKSNRFTPLYFVNCQIYNLLGYLIKKYYSFLPGVSSIYLAHGLALGELYPGLSDFDIAIIYKPSNNQEEFYRKLRSRWKKIQGFISARDILLFTENEFNLWQKYGGGWEPLDELKHWKLIYGTELRQDIFNLNSSQAEKDRFRYSLTKYYSLLESVIKEEPNSPFRTITVRRNLFKNFCYSVLSLNVKLLSIGNQIDRLSKWIEENTENCQPIQELLKIRSSRFQKGAVSTLRFSIGALGYMNIDKVLENFNSYFNSLYGALPYTENAIPLFNLQEAENRIKGLASNIADMLKKNLVSIILSSNGSPFGYMFFVVLKNGLAMGELEEIFKTVHLIFRIYDDSWFNEHFPAKVPIIYSKNMFFVHMQIWPFHKNNFHYHRRILYGEDLYKIIEERLNSGENLEDEILQEKISLSRSLHQISVEKIKPALFDFITLQYPRLHIMDKIGWTPGTVDEAVFYYERTADSNIVNLPKLFFEKYRNKNIFELSHTLTEKEFNNAISFLNNEFTDDLLTDKICK